MFRCSALGSMEKTLREKYDLHMKGIPIDTCSNLPYSLRRIYAMDNGPSEGPMHLIVVLDDAIHPALHEIYASLISPTEKKETAEITSGGGVKIEFCVAFDSISVVSAREIQKVPRPSNLPSGGPPDARVAQLLNILHTQFDKGCSTTTSLLCPSVTEV